MSTAIEAIQDEIDNTWHTATPIVRELMGGKKPLAADILARATDYPKLMKKVNK